MNGGVGVLEIRERDVARQQSAQVVTGAQGRSTSGNREEVPQRIEREHILTPEPLPDRREFFQRCLAGAMTGDVGSVHGTGRGPDQQVGMHIALCECLQHPDLH